MNPDSLEVIDYFKKSFILGLTDEFEWDTILISTTDKKTLHNGFKHEYSR